MTNKPHNPPASEAMLYDLYIGDIVMGFLSNSNLMTALEVMAEKNSLELYDLLAETSCDLAEAILNARQRKLKE